MTGIWQMRNENVIWLLNLNLSFMSRKAKLTPFGRMFLFLLLVVGLTLLFVYLRDNGHLGDLMPPLE